MIMEDARGLAGAAVQALLRQASVTNLPGFGVQTLPQFLDSARAHRLSREQKETICAQAILVLDQFYVHLPFKRARYAVDPVQRLRLLNARLPQMDDDLRFHSELLGVFNEMRDAHTFYALPSPFRGAMAFLPFLMQSYVDEQDERHYVVTNVLTGFEHPAFVPGVEITSWNGMPVGRAVELVARGIPAGNNASRFLRGLMRMTLRSLRFGLPPDEETVFVQYRTVPQAEAGESTEDRILAVPWHVATGITGDLFQSRAAGICEPLADQAAARHILWSQYPWREQQELQSEEAAELRAQLGLPAPPIFASLADVPESLRSDETLFSRVPSIFEFQHPSGLFVQGTITPDELCHSGKRFGYIRIRSFGAAADTIFDEFRRILAVMKENAPDGLILDVRGNPGGSIHGAERLLQLLTPRTITPASFHLANTPTILDMLDKASTLSSQDTGTLMRIMSLRAEFADWIEDGVEALAGGRLMTDGRPLTSAKAANDTGQVYQAPVALLVDSTSYSATDIFAAGFQDHEIGPLIGVDDNTGGGGACRWLHDEMVQKLSVVPGIPVTPLPGDAALGFAILRSSRTGRNAGYALEDVGVKRDVLRRLTKRDLMDWGSDLIQFTCGLLAGKTVYGLEIRDVQAVPEGLMVTVQARNLDRLVCYLDGHPRMVVNASDESFTVRMNGEERNSRQFSIEGYAWLPAEEPVLALAAAVRRSLAYLIRPAAPAEAG